MTDVKQEKKCNCRAIKIKHIVFALYLLLLFSPLGLCFYAIANGMYGVPVILTLSLFCWGFVLNFILALLMSTYPTL